jgi:hypothetical protein
MVNLVLTKNPNYLPLYEIEGTVNFDQNPAFQDAGVCPAFQEALAGFKQWLINSTNNSENRSIYKFGDGDYYFLRKQSVGSASPGKRALGKSYESLTNHDQFVAGVCQNDLIAVEIYNVALFKSLFPNTNVHLPAEYGYGLVSSRWLTHQFSGKIGLIGAGEKLDLISQLLKHDEYKEYLGIQDFNDYVKIPQKFACDDLDRVEEDIATQLKNSSNETKIFLVGIGHVKSGLLHRMKKYKNAIFYDVGSGIDALAGIVDFGRPYMGAWTNYRLRDFDYSKIDFLQYIPDENRERWL